MTIFQEEPIPRIFKDPRVKRIGSVQVASRVLGPLQLRLRADWEAHRERRSAPRSPQAGSGGEDQLEAPPPEVDPPETYGPQGERLHPHRDAAEGTPHLDLEG